MEKYLRTYAEPETAALDLLVKDLPDQQRWQNVVVIPACNETSGLLRRPPPGDGRVLMILVINESESVTPKVSLSNRTLAAEVDEGFLLLWRSARQFSGFELSLFTDVHGPRDILLVDRFSEGRQLPVKGGVGQARKIGVDLAIGLISHERINSGWIHCTDADVRLPDTYFTCCNTLENTGSGAAALLYPFHHDGDPGKAKNRQILLATMLYELSLRYYVAGMKFSESPYAFHTIGSTIAVSADHYTKVRGFPRRAAGEDFYLLNKLAKVGLVMELITNQDCQPIEIEARLSDRVPFGTGAAVNKITAMGDPVRDFRFYHPGVFELLRLWLQNLPDIWQSQSSDFTNNGFIGASPGYQQTAGIAEDKDQHDGRYWLLAGLREAGAQKALEHAFKQSKDLHQFERQMHTWFDAFRTLKLIHFLRDKYLSSISYACLETHQTFERLLKQDAELVDFHKKLLHPECL